MDKAKAQAKSQQGTTRHNKAQQRHNKGQDTAQLTSRSRVPLLLGPPQQKLCVVPTKSRYHWKFIKSGIRREMVPGNLARRQGASARRQDVATRKRAGNERPAPWVQRG